MTKKLSSGSPTLRRSTAALGVAGLIVAGLSGPAFADNGDTTTIDLLGINDFHGRIDANLGSSDDPLPAAIQLAAAVDQARDANPDSYFLGVGDLYGASTFTSMAGNDVPTTDILGAIGMVASAVGNHEFDYGFDDLRARIDGDGFAALQWDYLGANVVAAGTDNAVLDEYHIITTADGLEIAIIGVVTPETPTLVSPDGVAGLDFIAPEDAVARVIDNKADVQNADAIVVLNHDGAATAAAVTDTSTNFGTFVTAMAERGDIAAVFSGHTHVSYEVEVPVEDSDYDLTSMWVVQTGEFSQNLGKVSLVFDIDADNQATLVDVNVDMIALGDVTPPAAGENTFVDDVRDLLQDALDEADEIGSVIIGEAEFDLLRANQDLRADQDPDDFNENRGGESTLSNLIADVQLWSVAEQGAVDNLPVIAFMNPGGVRTNIGAGEVSYRDVAQVQPFANTLESFDLTGAQIKEVLEQQWQPEGASRPFLKLGLSQGFFYTYDPDGAPGERILEMFLDGAPIDLDATYRVLANNFLAAGGDNFFTLGEGQNYADTGIVDLQAFVDYFNANDVVTPDFEQRAVGVHWVTDPEATVTPGDGVEILLSSLVFSNDEPDQATKIIATLLGPDGEAIPVGEFEIDPEVVETTDEVGRAAVTFTLPEGVETGDDGAIWQLVLGNDVSEAFALTYPLFVIAPAAGDGDTDAGDGDTDAGDVDAGGDADGSGDADGDADGTGDGSLPDTGSDVTALLITTAILLAIGGTALGLRRRNSVR